MDDPVDCVLDNRYADTVAVRARACIKASAVTERCVWSQVRSLQANRYDNTVIATARLLLFFANGGTERYVLLERMEKGCKRMLTALW